MAKPSLRPEWLTQEDIDKVAELSREGLKRHLEIGTITWPQYEQGIRALELWVQDMNGRTVH